MHAIFRQRTTLASAKSLLKVRVGVESTVMVAVTVRVTIDVGRFGVCKGDFLTEIQFDLR